MSTPSIQPRLSSHHASRAQLLASNLSEASETSSLPSYHTTSLFSHTSRTRAPTGTSILSRAPTYRTLPLRHTPSATLQPPPITSLPSDLPPELTPDTIPEGPPPAYSLTPDTRGGEALLVQGPLRPFQQAPDPFVCQSQPNSHSPLGPLDSVLLLQQQPQHDPRRSSAASASQWPQHTPSPRAPPASTSTSTPGHSSQRDRQTLVQPETYLCHNCGNLGHENFDRSQMRTTPVRPHLPPPSDVLATQRTDMNTGRTPKSKQKRLRKFFSWTSRRQQLPTAHIPQPHAGIEDEDLQFQAAVQASLEEAGGDSWERTGYRASTDQPTRNPVAESTALNQAFLEQMRQEQRAVLREHYPDELAHLEDDRAYESFSGNAVEDEDEQLRRAIAESARMAREQEYTQADNEWANLESAYTGERTQRWVHSNRSYDDAEEHEEYEYENAGYDNEDTEDDNDIGQLLENHLIRSQGSLEQMLWEREAARTSPDEVAPLEDDHAYGSFSGYAVEDEDEQLRRAIAESAEMAREQGYAQIDNEWADLESTYTGQRTWVQRDRVYDENAGHDENAENAENYGEYEYDDDDDDTSDVDHDDQEYGDNEDAEYGDEDEGDWEQEDRGLGQDLEDLGRDLGDLGLDLEYMGMDLGYSGSESRIGY